MAKFMVQLRCVQCDATRTVQATGDREKDFDVAWPKRWQPVVRAVATLSEPFDALCPKHDKKS